MPIHTLNDNPSIYKTEKITIKKGHIVKEYVWKDTMGNEFEKVGNKFLLKNQWREPTIQKAPQQPTTSPMEDEILLDAMMKFSVGLLLFSVFLLGYCVGMWRKHTILQSVRKPGRNYQEVEEEQDLFDRDEIANENLDKNRKFEADNGLNLCRIK